MQINSTKSGKITGVGADKLLVVIDGASREEVDCPDARKLAQKTAAEAGFGSGGMCDQPIIGPIGPDGEMLEDADALNPELIGHGFRVEYTFAQRV